jgi:hypothetical protein
MMESQSSAIDSHKTQTLQSARVVSQVQMPQKRVSRIDRNMIETKQEPMMESQPGPTNQKGHQTSNAKKDYENSDKSPNHEKIRGNSHEDEMSHYQVRSK